jgi:putative RecB family exonuclease
MSLPLPASLSPSKVSSFKDCGLAFRFSAIDGLPEMPSLQAAKGTLVHRVLELLLWEEPAGRRTLPAALALLPRAGEEVLGSDEYADLAFGAGGDHEFEGSRGSREPRESRAEFLSDAEQLVRNYFRLEDPNQVNLLGTELRLSAQLGTLTLRGIIDRLELDRNGELVVTDYKTGAAPHEMYEELRLGGVHFYAFLCEQVLGRRPARVQLLHLREPLAISNIPSEQSIRGLQQRATAIWEAIELACEREDFRPRPGRGCDFCSFQAYCPAFGGDPALATLATPAQPAAAPAPPAAAPAPAPA